MSSFPFCGRKPRSLLYTSIFFSSGETTMEEPEREVESSSPASVRYRLRVDVAKPSEIYQPSFGPTRSPGDAIKPAERTVSGGKGPPSTSGKRKPAPSLSAGSKSGGSGRVVHRIISVERKPGAEASCFVQWRGTAVGDSRWEPARALNTPALLPQFVQAVRRVRALSEADVRSGNYDLAALGILHPVYFRGVSSRNPDGSVRKPVPILPAPPQVALAYPVLPPPYYPPRTTPSPS